MGIVIDRLRREHRNLQYLIAILGRQVESFAGGGAPNLGLMEEVVEYLTDYADPYHHDAEDRLIDLASREGLFPQAESAVLTEDHRVLAALGRGIRQTLERIRNDELLRRDQLLVPARDYLGLYRKHLKRERDLLLAVDPPVNDAQQAVLHRTFPLRPDPLETPENERFQLLHEAIAVHTDQTRVGEHGRVTCPACDAS